MSERGIVPVVMPKWGLSMKEGKVVEWLVAEGAALSVGQEIAEVETDKIDGMVEAGEAGVLRRRVAEVGRVYPIKALLAVLAPPSVPDAEIDAYIADYVVPAGEEEGEGETSAYRFTEVDGLRVRYARQGTGPPTVVLVHGFGGDADNWLFTLEPLAAVAEVVALDLPGHGQSAIALPQGDAGAGLGQLADFVGAVCDELGITRAAFVGHSLGGAVVAELARRQPEKVASLALIAPAGLGTEIDEAYLTAFVAARSKREMRAVVTKLFADESLVTNHLVEGLLRYKRLDGVSDVLDTLRRALFEGGQRELPGRHLGSLDVPVLVVWGREDRIIPAAHAAHAPEGAKVVELEGAGHMVQLEKANEVNALLVEHVAASPAGG